MRTPASRLRTLVLSAALCVGGGDSLRATSVVAPSFPELVAEADSIVRARVIGLRTAWVGSPQGSNPLGARTKPVAAALGSLAFEQGISAELSRRASLP